MSSKFHSPFSPDNSRLKMMPLRKCLVILMVLYVLSALFSLLAFIPMLMHVSPRSECLLFSKQGGDKLYYGHHSRENTRAQGKG